jgi:hypothetical protein
MQSGLDRGRGCMAADARYKNKKEHSEKVGIVGGEDGDWARFGPPNAHEPPRDLGIMWGLSLHYPDCKDT